MLKNNKFIIFFFLNIYFTNYSHAAHLLKIPLTKIFEKYSIKGFQKVTLHQINQEFLLGSATTKDHLYTFIYDFNTENSRVARYSKKIGETKFTGNIAFSYIHPTSKQFLGAFKLKNEKHAFIRSRLTASIETSPQQSIYGQNPEQEEFDEESLYEQLCGGTELIDPQTIRSSHGSLSSLKKLSLGNKNNAFYRCVYNNIYAEHVDLDNPEDLLVSDEAGIILGHGLQHIRLYQYDLKSKKLNWLDCPEGYKMSDWYKVHLLAMNSDGSAFYVFFEQLEDGQNIEDRKPSALFRWENGTWTLIRRLEQKYTHKHTFNTSSLLEFQEQNKVKLLYFNFEWPDEITIIDEIDLEQEGKSNQKAILKHVQAVTTPIDKKPALLAQGIDCDFYIYLYQAGWKNIKDYFLKDIGLQLDSSNFQQIVMSESGNLFAGLVSTSSKENKHTIYLIEVEDVEELNSESEGELIVRAANYDTSGIIAQLKPSPIGAVLDYKECDESVNEISQKEDLYCCIDQFNRKKPNVPSSEADVSSITHNSPLINFFDISLDGSKLLGNTKDPSKAAIFDYKLKKILYLDPLKDTDYSQAEKLSKDGQKVLGSSCKNKLRHPSDAFSQATVWNFTNQRWEAQEIGELEFYHEDTLSSIFITPTHSSKSAAVYSSAVDCSMNGEIIVGNAWFPVLRDIAPPNLQDVLSFSGTKDHLCKAFVWYKGNKKSELLPTEWKVKQKDFSERVIDEIPGHSVALSTSLDGAIIGGQIKERPCIWSNQKGKETSLIYLEGQRGRVRYISASGHVATGYIQGKAYVWVGNAERKEYTPYSIDEMIKAQNLKAPKGVKFTDVPWISPDHQTLLLIGTHRGIVKSFRLKLRKPLYLLPTHITRSLNNYSWDKENAEKDATHCTLF